MLLHDEWHWLGLTLQSGEERFDMPAEERWLLYRVAIETGLRAGELRSLTRGRLFLDSDPPYITCKSCNTKNGKPARQRILPDTAAALKSLIAQKTPKAPVFRMPGNKHLAGMLKADLAAARAEWMKAAINDPDEYARREQSDFLDVANHEGEVIDFHALRHTCGAWLAMAGVYPKTVQTVLRHSSITLTMDTYGHLFPGQEDEAVTKLQDVMGTAFATLAATGTDGEPATGHSANNRRRTRNGSGGCDSVRIRYQRGERFG